ncbi:hypothetical protein RhiirA4_485693 [Rhizophagus irregularis]|uniref:Uncharacterized protein n=1 Tax=Rhizophagus irregularis TaxID=588596 RepID=A0A2I1HQP8_9GLOM|nr:hypothetical protein RhiirA4_485693 [Rhizophagus irregularis]
MPLKAPKRNNMKDQSNIAFHSDNLSLEEVKLLLYNQIPDEMNQYKPSLQKALNAIVLSLITYQLNNDNPSPLVPQLLCPSSILGDKRRPPAIKEMSHLVLDAKFHWFILQNIWTRRNLVTSSVSLNEV